MIFKSVREDDGFTLIYISIPTIDHLGFLGVCDLYFKDVPKDVKVHGMNISAYGVPQGFDTSFGKMLSIRFDTTKNVFGDIEDKTGVDIF